MEGGHNGVYVRYDIDGVGAGPGGRLWGSADGRILMGSPQSDSKRIDTPHGEQMCSSR
jgi:hypothetical protein